MSNILKPVLLGASFVVLMCAAHDPQAPLHLGFVPEAAAIIGVAPGGSVVRRRAVVGTAAVASSTANANAAATANANAAAANANAAAAKSASGPPAVGTMVTSLPPGCTTSVLNGVEYQRCGSTYYQPHMAGSNLVFVVAQP